MKKYHKIDTLWVFDIKKKRFDAGQFLSKEVELLRHNAWEFTEKVDGTNLRIYWDGYSLSYAGRMDESTFTPQQHDFIQTYLVNESVVAIIEQKFKDKQVYIFGELIGVGIGKEGEKYVKETGLPYDFRVFDIEIGGVMLERSNAYALATSLGYKAVPIVLLGSIQDGLDYVENNAQSTFSEANLEGLVGVPVGNFRDRLGQRIIIKIKKRDNAE